MNPHRQRLKKDYKELKHSKYKFDKDGDLKKSHKLKCKLEWLSAQIQYVEDELNYY